MSRKTTDPVERFWKKVDKSGDCWEWLGGRQKSGHGFFFPKKNSIVRAHRYAWTIHIGEIPDGLFVLHKCDNPGCVNPAHLFLGTQLDNMRDMYSKNRQAKHNPLNQNEVRNHQAKLTEDQVLEIRRLYDKEQMKQADIMRKTNMSRQQISNIVRRKAWKHI